MLLKVRFFSEAGEAGLDAQGQVDGMVGRVERPPLVGDEHLGRAFAAGARTSAAPRVFVRPLDTSHLLYMAHRHGSASPARKESALSRCARGALRAA